MARMWYFPRWRNLLMQIVMWILLGGTIALAAMLDSHLRRIQAIDFAPAISDDTFSFQFPAGWKSWTQQADASAMSYVASDSSTGIDRTLIVSRQRLPRAIPPAEYILRADPLSGNLSPEDFKGVLIDGWPGQSINWAAHRAPIGADTEFQFSVCSAVVLPDDQAILIRLDKSAPFDAADKRLYQQVLEQVHIAGDRPTSGGTIQLAHNISLSIPRELSLYPAADPLRQERIAAAVTDDGGWISAEFVPVAIPGNEPSNSLVAGLCAREQLDSRDPGLAYRWLRAEITDEGPNRWTIRPPDAANEAVAPRRIAHLLTGDGGWGLLIILSAEPPATTADPELLWDELPANIHIAKSGSLDAELHTGAGIAQAASRVSTDATWWLWSRASIPIGYTHSISEGDAKYPLRNTVRRNWNGTVTAVSQQWGVSSDSGPWAAMKRLDAEANPDDPLVPLFDEFTTVSPDTIATIIHGPANTVSPGTVPFTPSFALSRYLPSLLARVDTQAAFWTDRFPGVESELFPSPLLLVARRCDDVGGLRCVEADVNGTGALSRWYFHDDGTLDHADFAGDLHLRPAAEADVGSAFAGDRRLTILPH